MLAGADHDLRPALAAGEDAALQGGQEAGLHDGRLAAARGADHGEQGRADEPCHQLGDEPLTTEEVLRVIGLERREALEGADHPILAVHRRPAPLAHGLELDDATGELILHRTQPRAFHLGAAGDARDAISRPLAGDVVDALGHPGARAEQPFGRERFRRLVRYVERCDLGDRGRPEALEVEEQHDSRIEPVERFVVPRGCEHERRAAGQLADCGQHVAGRLVGVVDDEEHRRSGAAAAAEDFVDCARRAGAGRVEHGSPGGVDLDGKLGGQTGLAHTQGARKGDQPTVAGTGLLPPVPQPSELRLAADERW